MSVAGTSISLAMPSLPGRYRVEIQAEGTPEILACDGPIACDVEKLRVGIAWSGSVVVQ